MADPTSSLRLDNRAILRVAGADARDLLDRLVTADLSDLTPNTPAIRAGLLTPQGKILFEMFIAAADATTVLIETDPALADDLAKRLAMYRLRADAAIEDVSESYQTSVTWETPEAFGTFWHAPDTAAFLAQFEPKRMIVERSGETHAADDDLTVEDVHDHLIEIGVGRQGADFGSGDVFPHDVNWDAINAVAFDKGCFIGQEVVSRTRHKAVPRRRLVQLFAEDQTLEPGAEIKAGEATLGTLGSVHSNGQLALAVVRLDRAISAMDADTAITAGGAELQIDPAAVERYRAAAAAAP